MTATVLHGFKPAHQRVPWWARAWRPVLGWVRALVAGFRMALSLTAPESEAEAGDWTEPEAPAAAPMRERPADRGPEQAPAGTPERAGTSDAPPQPAHGPQQRPEPPLVHLPAPPQDVLRNLAHAAMDMIGRDVTPGQVLEQMAGHMAELRRRARALENLERRTASNIGETVMDAALLAAADRRGESDEAMQERSARVLADMMARALRASDPNPTGVLPAVTGDMPDPRSMPTVPPDVASGDDAEPVSPVHADEVGPALPVPSEPFLADDGDPAEVPSLAAIPAAEVAPDRPWPAGAASVPSMLADRAMGLAVPVAPQRVDPEGLKHARAVDGTPGSVLCGARSGRTAVFPRFVDCPDCLAAWARSDAAAPQPEADEADGAAS